MTIQQILREKNLSRYQLSKKSGVPWATLADICSGKTTLSRCSAGTLMKLSSTLDIPMEQLITLTVEKPQMHGGKPTDRTYLEKNLPASLDRALREYIQGEKDKVSYMDCLWGELYSAINSNQWSNAITQEQADYLRTKYLSKNDPSQSLQMMERPLMTPDELKSIPKGSFVVMKTGTHPMQTKLRLFLDWGITFGAPYATPEHAARPVTYASRQELFLRIDRAYGKKNSQPTQVPVAERRSPYSAMGLYNEDAKT